MPYLANPDLKSLSYQDQLQSIFSYHFHYGDSLTFHLRKFGYDCHEILFDLEFLQKQWAAEAGCSYSASNWQNEILVGQIQTLKPDVLLLHNLQTPSISIMKRRKELFPFLKCLAVFRGYPETNRNLLEYLALADLVLVGSPVLQKVCAKHRLKTHLYHHFFDDRILDHIKVAPGPKKHSCTFLGTSGLGFDWVHQPRYYYLHQLLKDELIECWLEETSGALNTWKHRIKRTIERVLDHCPASLLHNIHENHSLASSVQKLAFNSLARRASIKKGYHHFPDEPLSELYAKRCNPPLFGLQMYQALSESLITFNKHSFAASGTVDNIRLFQATGVGSCLLTDSGSNLGELFEIDREVVAYSSLEECKEKIKYLKEHPAVAEAIAAKGKSRTVRDHTAANRARQLHEAVQNLLSGFPRIS